LAGSELRGINATHVCGIRLFKQQSSILAKNCHIGSRQRMIRKSADKQPIVNDKQPIVKLS
jgi:hypothetical protein